MDLTVTFGIVIERTALRRAWQAMLAARCAAAVRSLPRPGCRLASLHFAAHDQLAPRPALPGSRVFVATLQLHRCGDCAEQLESALVANLATFGFGMQLVQTPMVAPTPPSAFHGYAADADLCLDFLTPLVLGAVPARLFGAEAFVALVKARYEQAFGRRLHLPDTAEHLLLLTHYAQPLDIAAVRPATSAQQPRAQRKPRDAALAGAVFVRGASAPLVQALARLQSAHLVAPENGALVDWLGHYRLRWQQRPWLDRGVARERRLVLLAERVCNLQDSDPVVGPAGTLLDPSAIARLLAQRIHAPRAFEPESTQAFPLHRPGREPRIVERLQTQDLIAQQDLLRILSPVVERTFSPQSFGFRLGIGRADAIRSVRAWLSCGYAQVVECDIAQFFANIGHARLRRVLDRVLLLGDTLTRALLDAWISQPYVLDGTTHARGTGLAQGAPLSPMLANLYLTELDDAIDPVRFKLVRYADDFVVLTRTKADAAEALHCVQATVEAMGLKLADGKTGITNLQRGFCFLGETFTQQTLEPVAAAVAAQRKPLLVTEPYLQLGINGAAIEARRGNKLLGTWPLRRLSGLLILARANLSTALLERCSANDVSIAIALRGGKQIGIIAPNQRSFHEAQYRHSCWHDALSPSARLGLAQAVVHAKLHNYRSLVQQREPHSGLVEELAEIERQLDAATSTDMLRGHEGHAARQTYKWLQTQLVPSARSAFSSRRRERGAPDRLNSVLNFGYYLLYTRINAMLRLRGLNPYLGWLHDGDDDYETLVYDLMEPFRPFVDRMVFRLINRQELRPHHFELQDGQHWLSRASAAQLCEQFERTLGERVGGHLLRDVVWTQVRSVQELVAGHGPLWLFHWQPRAPDSIATGPVESPMWVASAAPEAPSASELGAYPQSVAKRAATESVQ